MSIDASLRQLRQFDTTGDGLKRGVSQLESNVGEALARVGNAAMPLLNPTNRKTANNYTASLDDLVVTAGTLKVSLPAATASNAGRLIGVIVTTGTVTVTSSSRVQGGTTDSLATIGMRLYMSTGLDWWRAP